MNIVDGSSTWTIIAQHIVPDPYVPWVPRLAYYLAPAGETVATHQLLINLASVGVVPIPIPEPPAE